MKTNNLGTELIEADKVSEQVQWAKNYIELIEKVPPSKRFELDPMMWKIYELAKAIIKDQLTPKEEQ